MASERLSRRKLAAFIAGKLVEGTAAEDVIKQAAAYLIETRQTHDVELLVRDIEEVLMEQGIVIADVTAAYPLTEQTKAAIADFLEAKELHVRETVDKTVLGGVRVELPGQRYDGTLRHKIGRLKANQR